jgi:hypothetical protein
VEIDYLTVLYVGLGAKIGDLHAKDSNLFRNRLITYAFGNYNCIRSYLPLLY